MSDMPADPTEPPPGQLRPEALTWAALLAHWMDYAKAAKAAAHAGDENAARHREGTVSVITLQAVAFALRDLARVPAEDRPFARDQAAVLVREHVGRLDGLWRGVPMTEGLLDLIADARLALRLAVYAGAQEAVWTGDDVWVMPDVDHGDLSRGTLVLMAPGTFVMPGEPVAWWNDRPAPDIPDCDVRAIEMPRQVYRQLNDEGVVTGDIIAPVEADLPSGLPLLVPLVENGEPVGYFPTERAEWEAMQRRAMPDGARVDVEHH